MDFWIILLLDFTISHSLHFELLHFSILVFSLLSSFLCWEGSKAFLKSQSITGNWNLSTNMYNNYSRKFGTGKGRVLGPRALPCIPACQLAWKPRLLPPEVVAEVFFLRFQLKFSHLLLTFSSAANILIYSYKVSPISELFTAI